MDYEVPIATTQRPAHDSYVVMQTVTTNNQLCYSGNGFDDSFDSEDSQLSNDGVEHVSATHTVSTTLQGSQNVFDLDIYASSLPSSSAEYYHFMEEVRTYIHN